MLMLSLHVAVEEQQDFVGMGGAIISTLPVTETHVVKGTVFDVQQPLL